MPPPEPIVSAARGWVGTRFLHQGRLKKTEHHRGGVDCLGLLIGVAKELHITNAAEQPLWLLDERDYGRSPDTKRLYKALATHLHIRNQADIGAGDIALLRIQGSPQHVGIISDYPAGNAAGTLGIIHAYAQARQVVEHALDEHWQAQIVAVFGVTDGRHAY